MYVATRIRAFLMWLVWRVQLSALVELQREVGRRLHGQQADMDSSDPSIHRPITMDEATIVAGVLKCHKKKIRDAMTPMEEVSESLDGWEGSLSVDDRRVDWLANGIN